MVHTRRASDPRSCSSPARAVSARPPRRAPPPSRSPTRDGACSWSAPTPRPTSTRCWRRSRRPRPRSRACRVCPRSTSTPSRRPTPTASAWWGRTGACSRRRRGQHRGAALGRVHRRDRRLRRVLQAAGGPGATAGFDHVVFDTAPTGTRCACSSCPPRGRPSSTANVGGTSCLGPLAGLTAQRALYAAAHAALRDPTVTTLVLVTRAERAAIREAERTRAELAALGVGRVQLIVNAVFVAQDRADPIARASRRVGAPRWRRSRPAWPRCHGSTCRSCRSGWSGSRRWRR
jgi:hypothetical protein